MGKNYHIATNKVITEVMMSDDDSVLYVTFHII